MKVLCVTYYVTHKPRNLNELLVKYGKIIPVEYKEDKFSDKASQNLNSVYNIL